jgi:hypothetical protein
MGLAKLGRCLVLIGLAAVAPTLVSGCKADKKPSVSSQAFLAPQLASGTASSLELLVGKLEILREMYRHDDGTTELDGKLLSGPPPNLLVLGKLDADRLLVFDQGAQKVFLTIDLTRGTVVKVLGRDEILIGIFRGQVPNQRPKFGPVLQLRSGWLLAYEQFTKTLFSVKADPNDETKVFAALVLDQNEIQSQLLQKQAVTISNMVEFIPGHVMVVPANLTGIHHLEVEDNGQTLDAHFILDPTAPLNRQAFLEFEAIRTKTGNLDVDVKDFPPVPIPGTAKILIFDRSKNTSGFLTVIVRLDPDQVMRTSVDLLSTRNEMLALIQGSNNSAGTVFDGQFRFTDSFFHPDSNLEPADPNRKTWLLAYDSETKTMVAIDWSKPRDSTEKLLLFSSATQLANRTDLHFDPDLDSGTFDTQLLFSPNDVLNNKLVVDKGPVELLGLNYETGQWVVVLHQRDVAKVTGNTVVNLVYLETVDPPPAGAGKQVRLLDVNSSSVVSVHLDYLSVPVSR